MELPSTQGRPTQEGKKVNKCGAILIRILEKQNKYGETAGGIGKGMDRRIYFKELTLVAVEASKFKIYKLWGRQYVQHRGDKS